MGRLEQSGARRPVAGLDLESSLLSLVGEGTLDLDGSFETDLRVTYSILENLGPITLFLYWIQDNLLRVSIRGSFLRPRIVVRNFFVDVFLRPDLEFQALPLPDFQPIPERF